MIEIKITGEAPLEVLADLTAFGWRCSHNQDVAAAAAKVYEAEQLNEPSTDAGTSTPTPSPAPAPAPEPPSEGTAPPEPYAETTPYDDPPPQTKAETKAKPTEKAPTLDAVRAAGIEAARKHGNAAVKDILTSLGVANMTALPEADRAAFLEALEGLGEDNA